MTSNSSPLGKGAMNFNRAPQTCFKSQLSSQVAPNHKSPYRFAYARTALKFGLKAIGLKSGDSILIPDFICISMLEPLMDLDISPIYYPVNDTLGPVWPRVEDLIANNTKALLIVHYFGQPQQLNTCVEFCNQHSLFLIEDNAHGHGSYYAGKPLGTIGDVGISAPRKSFPISNGAFLYLKENNLTLPENLDLHEYPSPPGKKRIVNLLKSIPLINLPLNLKNWIQIQRRRSGPPTPYWSQDTFRDQPIDTDYGMSLGAKILLDQQNMDEVRSLRRELYFLWQEWTSTQGLTPLYPTLVPGASPLVFPAVTESKTQWREFFERGHRKGVDIHSWPTFPDCIVKEDGNAIRLWERLLCFPIHQQMNPPLLERRLKSL